MTFAGLANSKNALPSPPALSRQVSRSLGEYGIALGTCTGILIVVLKLWHFDFNVPLNYEEDALLVGLLSKSIHEFGWYLENPRLGAPLELHLGDFPMADGLHQLGFKLLCSLTSNYVLALNLFYLLTFPLTTATALFVFKRFGIRFPAALVGSLLFTFLPFNFYRNICHIYLVSYYIVPLSIMTMLWLYLGRLSVLPKDDSLEQEHRRHARRRWIGSVAVCILQGFAGVYYAFFACYLLLVSGMASAWNGRRLAPIYTALVLVSITCAAVVANLAPHIWHRLQVGGNPEVAQRTAYEAEHYGLKISQLVLPVANHRLGPLARLEDRYAKVTTPSGENENRSSSLGAIGALGFIVLICRLFRRREGQVEVVDGLVGLNLAAVLLGTVGGLSALFAILVSPMIRGYNRISIYIAFFAFFMICLLIEQLRSRAFRIGLPAGAFYCMLCLALVVGLWDEVPASIQPIASTVNPQFAVAERWRNDQRFFQQVEAAMPRGAAVFQYPHMNFPESHPVNAVKGYEHVRGYLHTESLRWSYPMRGRRVDIVARQLSMQPIEGQVRALSLGGFSGIYIDRRGYLDNGAAHEQELQTLLQSGPIVSDDGTMSFYSMIDYAEKLQNSMTSEEWDAQIQAAWFSPVASFGIGFHPYEQNGGESWRWCGSQGSLVIQNPGLEPAAVKIAFDCATGRPEAATISLTGPVIQETLSANHLGTRFSRTVTVPPGDHAVTFSTDAKPLESPTDPRQLVFQVRNFRIEKLSGENTPRLASKRK